MINSPLTGRMKGEKKEMMREEDLIQIHHDMMSCYGWISFKEFLNIPIPRLLELNKLVQEEKSKRESLRLVLLKFCGVKNPK